MVNRFKHLCIRLFALWCLTEKFIRLALIHFELLLRNVSSYTSPCLVKDGQQKNVLYLKSFLQDLQLLLEILFDKIVTQTIILRPKIPIQVFL